MLGAAGGETLGATLRVAADDYDRGLAFSPVELCAAALASRLGPLGGLAAELARTLDWPFPGLGRFVELVRMRGPAGEFINVTWPGYVGALTALAPGRFVGGI